jgi:antitoxin component HigA of HigAB toxin-antitoxin module
LTKVFGSKSRVSEAVSGKREITKIRAKALSVN